MRMANIKHSLILAEVAPGNSASQHTKTRVKTFMHLKIVKFYIWIIKQSNSPLYCDSEGWV